MRSNPLPGSVPTMISTGRSGFQDFCANAVIGEAMTNNASASDSVVATSLFVTMDLIAITKLAVMIVLIFFSLTRFFSMLSVRVFSGHQCPTASFRPPSGAPFTFHFSGEA